MLNYGTFRDYISILSESTGKNLHLEHLEDEIINFGVDDFAHGTFPFS